MTQKREPGEYSSADIEVLEGLEAVRRRPGMYIGGVSASGLHHLVWEILDNSIDEAMNGHATHIGVTLHADHKAATIADNGRGIPVDAHGKSGKSALEVILTTLHAGGKFKTGTYKTSGGLHGVGASVVNALSVDLAAVSIRDGYRWEQTFRRGTPTGALKKLGRMKGHGTAIYFRPDAEIFPATTFDPALITARIEIASYIHQGVILSFTDEASGEARQFHHENGLTDYIKKIVAQRQAKTVHETPFELARPDDGNGARASVVLQWTEATAEHLKSYVNGIPTPEGGTHESGLKSGIGKAVRNYIDTHSLTPKGLQIATEDIREGLVAILSLFIGEPQFQGQTKEKLNNPETTTAIDNAVRPALEHW